VDEAVAASPHAPEFNTRFHQLERENTELKKEIADIKALMLSFEALEGGAKPAQAAVAKPSAPAPAKLAAKDEDEAEDNGVHLSGQDAVDEEAEKIRQCIHQLERENTELKKVIDDNGALILSLDARVKTLEGGAKPASASVAKPSAPAPAKPAAKDDNDGVDPSGNDEEDEEAEKIKQERVAAYAAEKSKSMVLNNIFYPSF